MAKPLSGVRVFDITLIGVGPWAGKLLGELGADVVHIETPGRPQRMPPTFNGVSIIHVTTNNNKRTAALDLKDTKHREAAYRLLRESDVFLENMRPGVMPRLGLDYETVSEINPQIVYLSASGYGQTGHMVPLRAADFQIQTISGWTSITGQEGGDLEFFRHFAHLDFNTSQCIVQAILMGLFARSRTGKGQKIEVAMLAAAMSLQSSRFAEFFATGETPPRLGSAASTTAPHEAFRCQDQRYLSVGVVQEEQWPALCEAIDRPDLAEDPRFDSNRKRVEQRGELAAMLGEVFATKALRWWEIRLTQAGVPNGRFLFWDDLRHHPQVLENGAMQLTESGHYGPLYHEGAPWQFSKSDYIDVRPAPLPDEHTEELLREYGVDARVDEPVATPAGD